MVSMVSNADMRGPSGVRDLLSGCWIPVCRSCRNGSLTSPPRTPPLPPVFVCISLLYPTVSVNALFRVGNFDFESRKVRGFGNYYSDFNEVLSGNGDVIPETFFYIVEGLAEVEKEAASLVAATAK